MRVLVAWRICGAERMPAVGRSTLRLTVGLLITVLAFVLQPQISAEGTAFLGDTLA